MPMCRSLRFIALVTTTLALFACKSDLTAPDDGVDRFIAAVSTSNGVRAQLQSGTAPTSNGSGITATTGSTVITGGSSLVQVASAVSFTRLVISVAGVGGYYEIALPSSATTQSLVITLTQADSLPFDIRVGAGTGGDIAGVSTMHVTPTQVGTGDVQVSVTWTGPSDVDLHVVDPAGEELYWSNPVSVSNGTLDLDSNAGCSIDNINNENVTWPTGMAPSGSYKVRVDYYSACGLASTDYVVTVQVRGQAARTYTGRFTGSGDTGGMGSGIDITSFTR